MTDKDDWLHEWNEPDPRRESTKSARSGLVIPKDFKIAPMPKLDLPDMSAAFSVSGFEDGDTFNLINFSLVDHCIYCGARNLDEPGELRDGSVCKHPSRLGGPLK